MSVEFKKHFVKNTQTNKKCRIWYSVNNHVSGKDCITIYAKGYQDSLKGVLDDYINDSDGMTDYFEKDRARFF